MTSSERRVGQVKRLWSAVVVRRAWILQALIAVASLGMAAPALAARAHVPGPSFGEAGSGMGQFDTPQGVAVNEALGRVYVVDSANNRVEYFGLSRVYEGELNGSGTAPGEGSAPPTGRFSDPGAIAVDNSTNASDPSRGDVYIADDRNHVIDKYSASGAYIGQVTGTATGSFIELAGFLNDAVIKGLAVSPQGELLVTFLSGSNLYGFSDAVVNAFLAEYSLGHGSLDLTGSGLAVDSHGDTFYPLGSFGGEFSGGGNSVVESNGAHELVAVHPLPGREPPTNEKPIEYPWVTPGGSGIGWPAVESPSEDVYVADLSRVVRFDPRASAVEVLGEGELGEEAEEAAAGVAVDSATGTVYVADQVADRVLAFPLEGPGKPKVEEQWVSSVMDESAVFDTRLEPNGAPTEYHFEYGRCTTLSSCVSAGWEASVPTGGASAGSEFTTYAASVSARGLSAGVPYHFRVVAHNSYGTTDGPEQALVTQASAGGSLLLDGRQWQMVTSPEKNGAFVFAQESETGGAFQAAASGDGLAYMTRSPTEVDPEGYAPQLVNVLALRGADGWSSQVVDPKVTQPTGLSVGKGTMIRAFSEDLSLAVVQPLQPSIEKFTPLAPDATEQTAYLRSDYVEGNVNDRCGSECFQPLVDAANVPSGVKFGSNAPYFAAATPDLSHVVLTSTAALTPTPLSGQTGLYEWSGGKLELVSELPPGEKNAQGGVASGGSIADEKKDGRDAGYARNAISTDGSRVVWQSNGHLYLRDGADTSHGESVRLDASQGGSGTGAARGQFEIASADDSRVFFLDSECLTSSCSASGTDLYEYDLNAPVGSRLTDLSVDPNAGEAANVSTVLGVSEDGSYVYFAAGRLTGDAAPGLCEDRPGAAPCDLYLYVRHDGVTKLIAGLSQTDLKALGSRLNRVSPNGDWLAFQSDLPLTGYDNRDLVSGQPDEEVYLYNVLSEHLVCASCDPTGARPSGVAAPESSPIVVIREAWGTDTPIDGILPPWVNMTLQEYRHQPRYLSNSGRLFFDSHSALVPQDVNGNWDAYEYEPPGVGDCSTGASTYSERSDGCVGLVSSGEAAGESGFLDASETGGDAFFITGGKLVAQDDDTASDIYDAHECTQVSPCIPEAGASPPPCGDGESCKGAQSPQPAIYGAPASATFSGTGNLAPPPPSAGSVKPKGLTRAQKLALALRACRGKRGGKSRLTCERRARELYGAKGRKSARRAQASGRRGR